MAMNNDYPKYLYKYQDVRNTEELRKDRSIDNLFKCQVVFSSRKKFNDLFDSKIKFLRPTSEQIEVLGDKLTKDGQFHFRDFIFNGQLTEIGRNVVRDSENGLDALIDKYLFFCLSKDCKNELMWAHYADSHKGFCIEFKSEFIPADKVFYQDTLPQIELIDFLTNQPSLGDGIWRSLRTKLKKWEHEDEYRFQANNAMCNSMIKLSDSNGSKVMAYDANFVEAVIFGCRTSSKVKNHIIKNIPYKVKFKQAVECTSSIDIIDLI